MGGAAFARRRATNHLGAVRDRLLGMERPVLASKTLADDLGVLVDENGHACVQRCSRLDVSPAHKCLKGRAGGRSPRVFGMASSHVPFTALTIFWAASSRSS